jgi:hypothetical protein
VSHHKHRTPKHPDSAIASLIALFLLYAALVMAFGLMSPEQEDDQ